MVVHFIVSMRSIRLLLGTSKRIYGYKFSKQGMNTSGGGWNAYVLPALLPLPDFW